jgi:hypothetical protein
VIGGQQEGGRTALNRGETAPRTAREDWLVLSCLLVREIKEEEGQLRVAGDRQREEDVSMAMKLFMIIIGIDIF